MASSRSRGRTEDSGSPLPVVEGPARNDAYVGLLIISLLAMIVGCVFLYLDYSQYPETKAPSPPPVTPPQRSAPADAGPGAPAPGMPPGGPAEAPPMPGM